MSLLPLPSPTVMAYDQNRCLSLFVCGLALQLLPPLFDGVVIQQLCESPPSTAFFHIARAFANVFSFAEIFLSSRSH